MTGAAIRGFTFRQELIPDFGRSFSTSSSLWLLRVGRADLWLRGRVDERLEQLRSA